MITKLIWKVKVNKMKNFKLITYIFIVFLIGNSNESIAQDGAALFNSNCAACHKPDENFVGPALKGSVKRWEENSSIDNMYEWVKNSKAVIESGDPYANKLFNDWNKNVMTANALSNEEIDAIMKYADEYVPEVSESSVAEEGEKVEKELKPDYESNFILFWVNIIISIVLVIGILIFNKTIRNMTGSNYFKNKVKQVKESNNSTKIILLIIGATFMSNSALALSFSDFSDGLVNDTPWILVENSDVYFMLTINVILLIVYLYVKSVFNKIMNLTRPVEEVIIEMKEKSVSNILTGSVAIEEEHTILIHHEYDGIQELDNRLPPWWLWGFYASIVFAIVYLLNHHVFMTVDNQEVQYEKEMAQAEKDISEYLDKMAMNIDETNVVFLTDDKSLQNGSALFSTNCVTCHAEKGEGKIGPNLTDKNWIYGYDIKDVFVTIKKGTPKGMPQHESKLNPIQLQEVSSYVLSLPEADGKAPEGEVIEE